MTKDVAKYKQVLNGAHLAHWYKALLYLKQEDTRKILEQLDIITQDSTNLYYNKALKLTQDIEAVN